ncbi:ParA family protein [Vibrio vulnificus]|uniref:ParA family protein n=1 Tax=Vibrio vulnificus TaxID=672 RepID=UPI001EEBDDE3|nr:ParA family protein [Vibrio vulnificus]MCG6299980.1 ParA family protein [Vibrio vulnificus]
MHILSVFNNKGGVGKTTLTYHVAHALSEMGKKVLVIDADPQCNLTIYSLGQEVIHKLWRKEDPFIDEGFEGSMTKMSKSDYDALLSETRSLHFLLKPTEEGTGDLTKMPPPARLTTNLDIIPGRLTLHLYEEKVASRWTDIYRGEPLAIRTITKIRTLAEKYAEMYGYDYVVIDTSPSLGSLNKVIISTVDGFFVPASPDLFSLYGIKNIGKALATWKDEFDIVYKLISNEKRHLFPPKFVTFLGYTIYNAKKYTGYNEWDLAKAHMNYARQIPQTIEENIKEEMRSHLTKEQLSSPIGGTAVMHTHNTFPSMAQYYNNPMWAVPDLQNIEEDHQNTLRGAGAKYRETKSDYIRFCTDLLTRTALLDCEE